MLAVVIVLALSPLVLAGWLWFTLLSPFGHHPPDGWPDISVDHEHRVFAYGTLRRPWVRWLVTGQRFESQPAILPGYRKHGLDIIPDPAAHTPGVVFIVSPDALRRLDRYERIGVRYERVVLRLSDGEPAWVYRRIQHITPIDLRQG